MKPTHILAGSPATLTKAVNALIARRDVALVPKSFTHTSHGLAAVIEEYPAAPNVPGSLVEIRAEETDDAPGFLESLAAENPGWVVEAAFAVTGKGKKPAALVVATLRQP